MNELTRACSAIVIEFCSALLFAKSAQEKGARSPYYMSLGHLKHQKYDSNRENEDCFYFLRKIYNFNLNRYFIRQLNITLISF